MSREWDIRELAAHDVLRLGGTDRTDNPHAPTGRRDLGERVVRRVPTTREQIDSTWRSSDRWTKELVRELARLGYDVESMVAERVYLTNVGRAGATVVLRVNYERTDGIEVERVAIGRADLTARQATLALRRRAAR